MLTVQYLRALPGILVAGGELYECDGCGYLLETEQVRGDLLGLVAVQVGGLVLEVKQEPQFNARMVTAMLICDETASCSAWST